jgi:hypothetical protein
MSSRAGMEGAGRLFSDRRGLNRHEPPTRLDSLSTSSYIKLRLAESAVPDQGLKRVRRG